MEKIIAICSCGLSKTDSPYSHIKCICGDEIKDGKVIKKEGNKMPRKVFNLQVEAHELDQILNTLAERTYREVAPLIQKIQLQANTQLKEKEENNKENPAE